VKVSSINCFKK